MKEQCCQQMEGMIALDFVPSIVYSLMEAMIKVIVDLEEKDERETGGT